jgi:multiple sugar transport system permease protein
MGLKYSLRIVLPLISPAIYIVTFIRFIDSFRVFDHIFVLTGGGPGSRTTSISIYIYKLFFQRSELGESVALSFVLLVVSLTLLYFGLKLVVRKEQS